MASPLDTEFRSVLSEATARLRPHGYRRRGNALRVVQDGMAGVIQFQRSGRSTSTRILFTVNVGVVCGALLPSRTPLARAGVDDAHSSERLPFLAGMGHDHWWEIDSQTDGAILGRSIADDVARFAIPFVDSQFSIASLMELWQEGRSFGLTIGYRQRLLARLEVIASFIGNWRLDPTDAEAISELGEVVLTFEPDGTLLYTIPAGAKHEVVVLRYRVDGSILVTDQESAPRVEQTRFSIGTDVLELEFEGRKCKFVRVR